MHFRPEDVRDLGVHLFEAAGTPAAHAQAVVDHLVEGSLMGIHSHGVIRVPDYLDRVLAHRDGRHIPGGAVDPAAVPVTVWTDGGRCLVDGRGGFGQIASMAGADLAIELATAHGVTSVTVRNQGHIGRLGAYTAAIACRGFVALGFCSGPRWAHWVAPFGGREGRFATNPMAFSLPTTSHPIVADFSTSAITEGGVRYQFNTGRPLPLGSVRDASGRETTDAGVLYEMPSGTIQPLGGAENGHKGSALSLLVDVMGTLLAGEDPGDGERIGNNVTLVAIRVDDGFAERADRYGAYVRSAAPNDPTVPVILPGDRELANLRTSTTVEVDAETVKAINLAAHTAGLPPLQPLD